jgi:hypothetical protein
LNAALWPRIEVVEGQRVDVTVWKGHGVMLVAVIEDTDGYHYLFVFEWISVFWSICGMCLFVSDDYV